MLHYNFAKMQLNSLSLRGFSQFSARSMSTDRRECANNAIACATTTLSVVLDEPDMRNSLVGVPLYLHAMITFAAVFLLKVHLKWKDVGLSIDSGLIQDLVERVIKLLNDVRASERHITYYIARGLSRMLSKFKEWEKDEAGLPVQQSGVDIVPAAYGEMRDGHNGNVLSLDFGPFGMYGETMELYGLDEFFPVEGFDALPSHMLSQ
jgi:hypothetical protein